MTLKEKTSKGLFWGGMNNLALQVIGAVFGIILGRLLSHDDFGMMTMLAVFSLVATALQNSGFTTALTNLSEPEHKDYNSVFWFNIIAGVVLYAILFFSAPLIADFYDTSELIPLCRYAFLSIMIASWGTAQNAWLFKNLRAKQQAKASMAAVLTSSVVGATMAYMGCRYWSLATQGLVFVLMNTLLVWHYSEWRPTMKDVSMEPARRMFRFSCKILATNIVTIVNNNILSVVLGRYYGSDQTGVYNQAYQWDFKCFSLVQNMVNQVAQPVLVDLRADGSRQLNALRKMMRFTAFISFPLLLGFGLVAEEFITLALSDYWLESALLIKVLCISGAVIPLSTLLSNMIISKGRSGLYFWCSAGLFAAQLVMMIIIHPYGLRTMVTGYVLLNILWLFVWHGFVWRMTGYHLGQLMKDIMPFALAAAAVMGITALATAQIENLWILLASRVIMAAMLYYVVMKVAKVQILKECENFLLKKKI